MRRGDNVQLLIPTIASIIDKLIPDADEASKAKARLIEMQVKGELDSIAGQLEINKARRSAGMPMLPLGVPRWDISAVLALRTTSSATRF